MRPSTSALTLLLLSLSLASSPLRAQSPPPTLEPVIEQADLFKAVGPRLPESLRSFRGLLIEERVIVHVVDLVPAIYFDAGEATIPARYRPLTKSEETTTFSESELSGMEVAVARRVLDVVGSRLRRDPSTALSVRGRSAPSEEMSEALATARARAVRDYLVGIWGIAPERLTLLPPDPGRAPVEREDEEMRVDLLSDDATLLRPIVTRELRRYPTPERMMFRVRGEVDQGEVVERILTIRRGGELWYRIDASTTPALLPIGFNWGRNGEMDAIPDDELPYEARLTMRLRDGTRLESDPVEIPVLRMTDERKYEEGLASRDERIRMTLLFNDSSAVIDRAAASLLRDYIAEGLQEEASARVIGLYPSNGGDPELADRRRRAVVDLLLGMTPDQRGSLTDGTRAAQRWSASAVRPDERRFEEGVEIGLSSLRPWRGREERFE